MVKRLKDNRGLRCCLTFAIFLLTMLIIGVNIDTGVSWLANFVKAASTEVGGIINEDTSWTQEGSPYTLTNDVQIDYGVTLTVEPGVIIEGNNKSIQTWGLLRAIGTQESQIHFNNVHIRPGSSGPIEELFLIDLQYCILNSGSIYRPTGSEIYGSLNLRDSVLEDCGNIHNGMIYLWYPRQHCYIERNVFINSSGIYTATSNANVYIRNNLFIDQYTDYAVTNAASYNDTETSVEYNSFLSTNKVAVMLPKNYSDAKLSAINNFWNTTDSAIIESMIFDRNDDLSVAGYIEYNPYLEQPHEDTPKVFFTITIAIEGLGTTVPSEGDHTYELGSEVELSAFPDSGYHFVNWTEGGEEVSAESTYSFIADSDRTLVANFALNEYEITVAPHPLEGGSVSGGGVYTHGEDVTVTATANEGYHFVKWTDGDITVSTSSNYSFVAESDRTLLAHFTSNYVWESIEGGVRITDYLGPGGDLVIPDTLGDDLVLEIKDNIYWDGVFAEKGLTSVSLPSSLTYIGEGAFYNNSLKSVIIGNNVTEIGERAFANNVLSSVGIGDSTTNIGDWAFSNNQLTAFTIPNNITHIGDGLFYANRLNEIIIPEGVTYIGRTAFRGNRLTSITIPDGVIHIGVDAFWSNQIESVTIPDSVTHLGAAAFGINNLTSVQIPDKITTIENHTFSYNRLTTLTIPNNVTTIKSHAFMENYLTSIVIPDSVTVIDSGAFRSNRLESVTIPESVTTIGQGAFDNNQSNPEDLIIYGIPGSAAEIYANYHGHTFLVIPPNLVESIIISGEDGTTSIDTDGGTLQMIATVFPEDADVQSVTWSVIPETGSAEISQSGLLTATGNGTVTVKATAQDDSGIEGSIEITITNQLSKNQISASANPAFSGTVTGGGTYLHGVEVALQANPAEGYGFLNWTEGGEVVCAVSEYIFIAEVDRTLVANFALNEYEVTVTSDPLEGGSVSGGGVYTHGEDVTLTAIPENRFRIYKWKINGTALYHSNDSHTLVVNDNTDVTLEFVLEGDLNLDLTSNITDLVILRRYLAGLTELTEKALEAADMNNDGVVNITDLVILRRRLAGLE